MKTIRENISKIFILLFVGLICFNANAVESLPETNNDDFLEVDDAFKVSFSEQLNSDATGTINFAIAPGHYLYKKRISVTVENPASISQINFPQSENKNDPSFGSVEIYHQTLALPFKLNLPNNLNKAKITVNYQGCSEKGLCYPPTSKTFLAAIDANANNDSPVSSEANLEDSNSDGTSLLKSGNFWLIIFGFFGFGLLLSLTPCVFPMIPILSGIIVGQENSSRGHVFALSLAYTLGMSFSYTVAGILAALTGNLISNMLQNPWVLGSFSLVFVLLSLSMFGFYELQLPGAMGTNLTKYSNRLKAGKFLGVFSMGALSALIVSPCVAAPLAGALIFISKTHDIFLGGSALFSLSMGMGVPLLIIGASAGVLLPKAGNWMNVVKNIFGVLMLGLAIWIVSPVLNKQITMFLYAILTIISSVYLGAFEPLLPGASGWKKLNKGFALVIFMTGVLIFFNAYSGNQSNNVQNSILKNSTNIEQLNFKKITSGTELAEALQSSKGRYVMLDFYADWCAACKEYEETSFKDSGVVSALKQFNLMQVDVTANTVEDKKLLKQFSLYGPPGIVFFDKSNNQIMKIIGYQNPQKFYASISKILTEQN